MQNKLIAQRGCEVDKVDKATEDLTLPGYTTVSNSLASLNGNPYYGANVEVPDVHKPDLTKIVEDEV
jgi:hypothetical protein